MTSQHPMDSALHYRVRGAGRPVIALHGSASTGAQWRSLVGYLEGRFRIFTPDLPGYGASAHLPVGGLAGDARGRGCADRRGSAGRCIWSGIPMAARWR